MIVVRMKGQAKEQLVFKNGKRFDLVHCGISRFHYLLIKTNEHVRTSEIN